ncbi:phage integrase family protein [Acidisarcina polymorpha]|uniref:Phage integrase family protein n=1 Tax=Acidisarcina polymorpha TaxID=2211140 RepID=A0A2Z5G4Y5_9BACT|nr:phage integrase family protein [Acidisarcina polymorpha]
MTIPAGVKSRIAAWVLAAGIVEGRLFRPVTKAGVLAGEEIRDEKAVWRLVMRYARASGLGKLAPHDPRRTCAKLRRKAGSWSRSSCYLATPRSRHRCSVALVE